MALWCFSFFQSLTWLLAFHLECATRCSLLQMGSQRSHYSHTDWIHSPIHSPCFTHFIIQSTGMHQLNPLHFGLFIIISPLAEIFFQVLSIIIPFHQYTCYQYFIHQTVWACWNRWNLQLTIYIQAILWGKVLSFPVKCTLCRVHYWPKSNLWACQVMLTFFAMLNIHKYRLMRNA